LLQQLFGISSDLDRKQAILLKLKALDNDIDPSELWVDIRSFFPDNVIILGEFTNCWKAIEEARKHYTNIDGCYYCCNPCHTR